MSVEKPSGLNDLNIRWPLSTDHPTEGDNHIRLIKEELVKAFALFDTPITVSSGQINGVISKLKALGATLTSSVPFFAPNPSGTDNTTRVSTTHWVRGQVKAAIAPLQTAPQVVVLIANALKNYYTKAQVYSKAETVAQITTKLAGYYTKALTYSRTEVAAKIAAALTNYYTKAQTTAEILARIATALKNYYTKAQIDAMVIAVKKLIPLAPTAMVVNHTVTTSATLNAWTERPMNSIVSNTIGGAKLASGVITLPAGTYVIDCSQRFDESGPTQAALLIATAYHYGLGDNVRGGSGHAEEATFTCAAVIAKTAAFTVKVMYRVSQHASGGSTLGAPIGFGHDVHAHIRIIKVG